LNYLFIYFFFRKDITYKVLFFIKHKKHLWLH